MTKREVLLISAMLSIPMSWQTPGIAMQAGEPDNIFTIVVAAPTSAKEVQVRYIFTDELPTHELLVAGSAWASSTADNKIVIKADIRDKSARSFAAIAYAPGCQFVTISIYDLTPDSRQSEFQCHKLPATRLAGRANVSQFGGRELQVEVLYEIAWASKFFGVPGISVSPLSLGKADVGSDGSFALEVPDFSADPIWQSLSQNATLAFSISYMQDGVRIAMPLQPSGSLSVGPKVKVAPTYPEIDFAIQRQDTASN
jgi:hypothetical protein